MSDEFVTTLKLDLDFEKMSADDIRKLIGTLNLDFLTAQLGTVGLYLDVTLPKIIQSVSNLPPDTARKIMETYLSAKRAHEASVAYILQDEKSESDKLKTLVGFVIAHMAMVVDLSSQITPTLSKMTSELAREIGAIDMEDEEKEKD